MLVPRRIPYIALALAIAVLGAAVYLATTAGSHADKAQTELRHVKATNVKLTSSVAALQDDVGNQDNSSSLAALSNQVDNLQQSNDTLGRRLAKICAGVTSERSKISGEQTADNYSSYQYYGDLYDVLNAVCP
jgi:hypothetical protein